MQKWKDNRNTCSRLARVLSIIYQFFSTMLVHLKAPDENGINDKHMWKQNQCELLTLVFSVCFQRDLTHVVRVNSHYINICVS